MGLGSDLADFGCEMRRMEQVALLHVLLVGLRGVGVEIGIGLCYLPTR